MTFKISQSQLAALIPGNPEVAQWHSALVDVLPKYQINTQLRVAGFIAQCAHESNNFRNLEENLNYSWQALRRVFPRYFPTDARAKQFERQPEKIANIVYMDANRTPQGALGNVQTGDGWRFRGRGIKQLTGRNNYAAFGKTVGMTAEEAAHYVSTKKGAIESACWFWQTNNLNAFADRRDIEGMSKRINGGNIGMSDRIRRWNRALEVLNTTESVSPIAVPSASSVFPLRRGSQGNEVRRLQQALGLNADGVFGPVTERAVRQWQQGMKLVSNGTVDANTYRRITT